MKGDDARSCRMDGAKLQDVADRVQVWRAAKIREIRELQQIA